MDFAQSDKDTLSGIYAVTGFNLVDWGHHETGLTQFEQALVSARSSSNRRREIWALGIGGWGQLRAGKPAAAKEWLSQCLNLCNETAWIAFQPWVQALLVEANIALGPKDNSSQVRLEEALALSRQLGDPCWEAANGRAFALVQLETGDLKVAEAWLSSAREMYCSVTDLYAGLLVEIVADQMRLQQQMGNQERTQKLARELLSLAARTHADAHLELAMNAVNSHR